MRRATRPFGRASAATASGSSCELMPSFKQQQRLGAQLRDPRLAHAELVGEVLHRTLFEEVADHDALQPLGQRVHRVDEVRLALAVEDRVLGAGVVAGDERLGVALEHERVVVEDGRAVDVVDELVHRLGRDVEHRRDLFGRRRAAELVRQLFVRGLQAAGPGPDRAARPVAAAQLVEQRAADAGRGEAVERDAALGVEAPGGLREAEHARPTRGRCGSRGSAPGGRPRRPRTARAGGAGARAGPRSSPARCRCRPCCAGFTSCPPVPFVADVHAGCGCWRQTSAATACPLDRPRG